MEFIDKMKAQARQNIKTIILPEVEDIRILQSRYQKCRIL